VFRENFVSFVGSHFRDFRVSRKLSFSRNSRKRQDFHETREKGKYFAQLAKRQIFAKRTEIIFSLAGKTKNTNKDKEIAIAGLNRNISLLEAPGIVFSFLNSNYRTTGYKKTIGCPALHILQYNNTVASEQLRHCIFNVTYKME
jgi:hypothetical protein